MEKTLRFSGLLGDWTLTVALDVDTEQEIDEETVRRALDRFGSLDRHFCDIVNLTDAFDLVRR